MNPISLLNAAPMVRVRSAWSEGRWHARVSSLLAARQDRPLLSLVACPLAILAVTLTGSESPAVLWLLVPLVILTWYWGSTEWPWTWVLGVMEACYGVQWAVIGTYCVAAFPHDRIVVGVLWAAYAGGVAGVAHFNRKRAARYAW
jgi:hypothetical protein